MITSQERFFERNIQNIELSDAQKEKLFRESLESAATTVRDALAKFLTSINEIRPGIVISEQLSLVEHLKNLIDICELQEPRYHGDNTHKTDQVIGVSQLQQTEKDKFKEVLNELAIRLTIIRRSFELSLWYIQYDPETVAIDENPFLHYSMEERVLHQINETFRAFPATL